MGGLRWAVCPKCRRGRVTVARGPKDSTLTVEDVWGRTIRPHFVGTGSERAECKGSGAWVLEQDLHDYEPRRRSELDQ